MFCDVRVLLVARQEEQRSNDSIACCSCTHHSSCPLHLAPFLQMPLLSLSLPQSPPNLKQRSLGHQHLAGKVGPWRGGRRSGDGGGRHDCLNALRFCCLSANRRPQRLHATKPVTAPLVAPPVLGDTAQPRSCLRAACARCAVRGAVRCARRTLSSPTLLLPPPPPGGAAAAARPLQTPRQRGSLRAPPRSYLVMTNKLLQRFGAWIRAEPEED